MEENNSNKTIKPIEISSTRSMKMNWGSGIVVAFIFFISFILYFVIKVQSNSKYDNELVVEEYYKHDAHFGKEMIRLQNAQDLKQKILISNNPSDVSITFPNEFKMSEIKGKISFYRASNKNFDFEIPISGTHQTITILKDKILGGQWQISIEWKYKEKDYLIKEMIYIN